MSISKLITSVQLAQRLGLKPQTVNKWRVVGKGGPEFIRINGHVYYEEAAVQAWLDSSRHRSTAEYDASNGARGFQAGNALARRDTAAV